jgi:hypothetical protein
MYHGYWFGMHPYWWMFWVVLWMLFFSFLMPVRRRKGSIADFRLPRENGLNASGAGHGRVQVASL